MQTQVLVDSPQGKLANIHISCGKFYLLVIFRWEILPWKKSIFSKAGGGGGGEGDYYGGGPGVWEASL